MSLKRIMTLVGLAMGVAFPDLCQGADSPAFGKVGEPIHLKVGYQPPYAEGWSALVIEGKQLWKNHLPAGSTVDFLPAAAGGAIISQMVAGKVQLGYVGDMPALLASSRPDLYDIRMIAMAGHSQQQCNVLLLRKDAPKFDSAAAAVRWTNGKVAAAPHGSCADRFARAVFSREEIKPEKYFNYGIDALIANFKAGKLDAAVVWEPAASRLVAEGLAQKVATGTDFGEGDSALVIMPQELIAARPDIYRAWLDTELEAQSYLADPTHAGEVVKLAAAALPAYPKVSLWHALYGGAAGSSTISYPFGFTAEAVEDLGKSAHFLADQHRMVSATVRSEATLPEGAADAVKARGLAMPLGTLHAQPDQAFAE